MFRSVGPPAARCARLRAMRRGLQGQAALLLPKNAPYSPREDDTDDLCLLPPNFIHIDEQVVLCLQAFTRFSSTLLLPYPYITFD